MRGLEIGPGMFRAKGFETFNLGDGKRSDGESGEDHVGDARDLSRFDQEFDYVYSSHCLEHVHWYELHETVRQWASVLKPAGVLEIHVPNGLEVMEEMIRWEKGEVLTRPSAHDLGWRSALTRKHPFLWLQGKLYNYTKTRGVDFDYQLHRSMLTPKFLTELFTDAGMTDVVVLREDQNYVPDNQKRHGWMNLGVRGIKK